VERLIEGASDPSRPAGIGVAGAQGPDGVTDSSAVTATATARASIGTANGSDGCERASVAAFLSRVVPWPTDDRPGYVNLHWHRPGSAFRGEAVKSIDEFFEALDKRANEAVNFYFCLSQQATAGKLNGHLEAARTGAAAVAFRAIWLDIDIKPGDPKCYATKSEAITAFGQFLEALPGPTAVVMSGGGMHVYWINKRPMTQEEWRPYAEGLKVAAQTFGLKCDAGCTADAARVLRVPGTKNWKTDPPRPVFLQGMSEEDYDFPVDLKMLPLLAPKLKERKAETKWDTELFPKRAEIITESLSDGLPDRDKPLPVEPIAAGCAFIRGAIETGGRDYSQPLWNLTTLAATFLEDGHGLAHIMGDKHPEYTPESTDELWARKNREREAKGLGWPSCRAIRDAGCADCATCPHFAKGKSPLHLGLGSTAVDHPSSGLPVAVAKTKFRDLDRHGKPKASLANAVIAIRTLGIEVRYDLFHNRVKVTYKSASKTIREGLLTDDTVSATRSLINNTFGIDCGDNTLAAIKEIAFDNSYDPVLDMLDDCQANWDGGKRIDTWVIDYFGCEDTPLNRAIGRKVLIAACRRARHPGCKFDNITVLGGVEGTNKSTAIRVLAGDENFSDQSIIGAKDKEVQEQLDGVWMHENADLAGMRRAEVEQVKAFASRQVDRARPAYARVREDRPRRSIEWGTTNNKEYLLSQTGNRRFWPLETGKIDIEALKRDREQLLAEAATYEAAGESITLNEDLWGEARDAQEQRRVTDPWEDILAQMPDSVKVVQDGTIQMITIIHKSGDGYERVASADMLKYILRLPEAQQTSAHGQRLAQAMERVGWKRNRSGRVTINGVPVRGYVRPAHGSLNNPQINSPGLCRSTPGPDRLTHLTVDSLEASA
jgi:predicted P-loop ATPase